MVLTTVLKFVFFGLVFTLGFASLLTLLERKQSAYSQDRLGPQRAHFVRFRGKPFVLLGLWHIIADSVKMFLKETHDPRAADTWIFRTAPLIGFVTALVTLAFIPFGPDIVWTFAPNEGVSAATCGWYAAQAGEVCAVTLPLQIARVDAGLLYVLAVGSLGVYGAALAGWSSNNRFGLLGGLRASAQSVSYEVALGLTIVGVLIAYGSTEPSAIVAAQGGITHGFLPNWGIFIQPLGATLFFVAAVAETKRAPFDMPEGESEIIGYFIEYSSMGFAMFMLSEFIEIVVLASLFTTLFLGGWQLPNLLGDGWLWYGFGTTYNPWVVGAAGTLVFLAKVIVMSLFQLQVRWTLPRFRYDQVMRLGWKTLLPLALVNIFVTAGLVWFDPTLGWLGHVGVVLILLFILVVIAGPRAARRPAHGH
jgi:NADH-quinone oxidoreductase subunit H